jgi:hypothetical protein
MSDVSTRIIELGSCVDNRDPLGLGRIRIQTFGNGAGPSAGALKYDPWDDKDPFIAIPFLPSNINYIPLIGQSVKIINYDPNKDTVNREYITGPFTTTHDFNTQVYSSQVKNTTYGGADGELPKIINKNDGEIIDSFVKSSIAKYNDYAIYGKNGSDLLFTEDGLSLRGGKFVPKTMVNQSPNTFNKPYMSNKMATLHLKKYSKKLEYYDDTTTELIVESKTLKSIIEYSIDKFDGSNAVISFYVYLIKDFDNAKQTTYGNIYSTNNPKLENSPIISGNTQLITTGTTEPTFTVNVSDILSNGVNGIYKKIRHTLKKIHNKTSLFHIDPSLPFSDVDLHPFYFRPTLSCVNTILSTQNEIDNRVTIFNNIILAEGVGPKSGLVYDKTKMTPTAKPITKTVTKLRETANSEQTFSSLKSDKIFFLSPESNPPEKQIAIDFSKLEKYELSQENYMNDILPHTFSSVRGETLIRLIESIINLIFSHQHNLVGPPVPSDPNYIKLMKLMETMKQDILNNSIRIN